MGRYISDRIFGSDIAGPIKETLEQLQNQEKDTNFGKNIDSNAGTSLDLSSRKPWARMWTAIRGYTVVKDENGNDKKQFHKGNVRIYEVGNHAYDDYNLNRSSNNSPSIDEALPKRFLSYNEFNKPAAGITSIQSTSQGPNGIYWETIVNFRVFNFFDYSNIFSKFFLYPGARIFVDFGWDTSDIYEQQTYFSIDGETDSDADSKFNKFTEDIFSFMDLGGTKDGKIAKSGGSFHVIEGYVTDWNAKTLSDGSFECSITITSGNKSLLEYENGAGGKLADVFTKDITKIITEKFLSLFNLLNEDFFDLDFMFRGPSDGASNFYKIILNKLQSTEFYNHGIFSMKNYNPEIERENILFTGRTPRIPDIAYSTGVFSIPLDTTSSGIDDYSGIYITIQFLEDELLNKNIGTKFEGEINKEIVFNSANSVCTFDENLYKIQEWTPGYENLIFLYPGSDFYGETSKVLIRSLFVKLEDVISFFKSEDNIFSAIKGLLDRINDASENIMRLRLKERGFNSLSIVDINSSAINSSDDENNNTIEDGVGKTGPNGEEILSNNRGQCHYVRDNNPIEILCPNESNAINKYNNFDNLFIFDPYSKTSIVSNMDLSLEMPSNTMSSIIAINATSVNKQIYPGSPGVVLGMGIKDMHTTEGSGSSGKSYYEWLPTMEDNVSDNLNDFYLYDKLSSDDIPKSIGDDDNKRMKDNLTKQYKKLFGGDNYVSSSEQLTDGLTDNYNGAIQFWKTKASENSIDSNESDKGEEYDSGKVIEADSIPDYFRLKLKNNFIKNMTENGSPFILPYSLNLSFYGISGIFPGNVFRVNYLPKVYTNKIVFIMENIVHNVSSGKWTTTIGSYSIYRTDKMFNTINVLEPEITWNPKFLSDWGYSEDQIKTYIKNPNTEWWDIIPEAADKTLKEYYNLYNVGDGKLDNISDGGNTAYVKGTDYIVLPQFDYGVTYGESIIKTPCSDDPSSCGCTDDNALNYNGSATKDCIGNSIGSEFYPSDFKFGCCVYGTCGDWLGINWTGCTGYGEAECYHYLHSTPDYSSTDIYYLDYSSCFFGVDYDPTNVCQYPEYSDNEFYAVEFCDSVCGLCGSAGNSFGIGYCDKRECIGYDDELKLEYECGGKLYTDSSCDNECSPCLTVDIYTSKYIYKRYGLAGTQGMCLFYDGLGTSNECFPNLEVCRSNYAAIDDGWEWFWKYWGYGYDQWPEDHSDFDDYKIHYMWHQYGEYDDVSGTYDNFPNYNREYQCTYADDNDWYSYNTIGPPE